MSRFVIAGVVAAVLAGPSAAREEEYVKLIHVETGKALSVADDSGEAGAKAVLAKADDGEAQQWKIEKDGEHIKLTNKKSGKVLDVFEDSKDEDAAIIQWDDKSEGSDNQRWSWDGGGTERRLKSKSSGLVVAPDKDGNIVQKKPEEKEKTQLWKVVPVKK